MEEEVEWMERGVLQVEEEEDCLGGWVGGWVG